MQLLADNHLVNKESVCQSLCNPYQISSDCSRAQPERCFQSTVQGSAALFYTHGCAFEDSDCEDVHMSKSITKAYLSPMTILPGRNIQPAAPARATPVTDGGDSLHKIGHTNNCFKRGVFKDADASKSDNDKIRLMYETNANGQVSDIYFPYAVSRQQLREFAFLGCVGPSLSMWHNCYRSQNFEAWRRILVG